MKDFLIGISLKMITKKALLMAMLNMSTLCLINTYTIVSILALFKESLSLMMEKYPIKYLLWVWIQIAVLTVATSLFEYNIRPMVLTHYCGFNGGKVSHQAGVQCLKSSIGDKQILDIKIDEKTDLSAF
ncbi:hypothetical protein LU293_02570 [Moraxella nasovis]|uniref:hypothetical protein n=1 Tax=Moraxella nasovis TaxID=2904121 RepID=UPI001F61A51B|nr:hypothetical protein [Moraxella nasovis]UNU73803.1 hypothetical protein LU293_02570 [Moraxella nasovis]